MLPDDGLEEIGVLQPLEIAPLVDGDHVVAAITQFGSDPIARTARP